MIIALASDGEGKIAERFRDAKEFLLYEVAAGRVLHRDTVHPETHDAPGVARFLQECNADLLICNKISTREYDALDAEGIKLVGGISGADDSMLNAYLNGSLEFRNGFKYNE